MEYNREAILIVNFGSIHFFIATFSLILLCGNFFYFLIRCLVILISFLFTFRVCCAANYHWEGVKRKETASRAPSQLLFQ